jgi:hypothetical protein
MKFTKRYWTCFIASITLFVGEISCFSTGQNYNGQQSPYYYNRSNQYKRQPTQYNNQASRYNRQPVRYNSQTSYYNRQPAQYNYQASYNSNRQPTQYNSQTSQYTNRQTQYNHRQTQYNRQPSQTTNQPSQTDNQPSPAFGGSSILAMLGQDGSPAGAFMMSGIPTKSPVELTPEDKELLDDTCSGCHDMNRVFWTRGTREIWETILAKEYHDEMGLEPRLLTRALWWVP